MAAVRTHPGPRRFAAAVAVPVALVVVGLFAAGCGSKASPDSTEPTGYTLPVETTAPEVSTVTRQACTEANLAAAAQAQYPGTTVTGPKCSSTWAVAGLRSARLTNGVGVGFFTIGSSGAWELVKVALITDDLVAVAPPGFVVDLLKTFVPPQTTTTTAPQVTDVTWVPSVGSAGGSDWFVQAVVSTANAGRPVAGALVEGRAAITDPAGGQTQAVSCSTDAAGTCTLRVVLSGGAAAARLQVDKVTAVPAAGPFALSVDVARP